MSFQRQRSAGRQLTSLITEFLELLHSVGTAGIYFCSVSPNLQDLVLIGLFDLAWKQHRSISRQYTRPWEPHRRTKHVYTRKGLHLEQLTIHKVPLHQSFGWHAWPEDIWWPGAETVRSMHLLRRADRAQCSATQLSPRSQLAFWNSSHFGFFATIAHICGHELPNSKDLSAGLFGSQTGLYRVAFATNHFVTLSKTG